MKKLVVLLLAFAVAGAAFAQTPALSASSTLSWGVDLDTGYTGFENDLTAEISIPFAVADGTATGDKGWWGHIAVTDITFVLTDDPLNVSALGFTDANDDGDPASLTAYITNGTWKVSVSSFNDLDFANADALDDGDVAVVIDAETAGTTVSYAADALGFGVTAVSKGDWLTNTLNEYAFGANVSYKLSDALSVSGAVAYDLLDADTELGFTAGATYTADPLTVALNSDMFVFGGFDADALLAVDYAVMEGFDAFADVYFSTLDSDLEVEVGADYDVAPLEAGALFGLYDPLSGISYNLELYAGYTLAVADATELYVYAKYTNDFTGTGTLVPNVKLTNTSITNTTLTLEYNGSDVDVLSGSYGTIIAAATVEL